MPFTIKADVGASDANSFVTVDEMTAYCEGRLNASIWNPLTTSQHPALAEATRDISVMPYKGTRVTNEQALSWPRFGCINPDASAIPDPVYNWTAMLIDAAYYPETIIPQRVKDATCELALQYLKAGGTDLASADANRGVTQKVVGPLSTTWESGGKRPTGMARYPRVQALLYPLLADAAAGTTLVRT